MHMHMRMRMLGHMRVRMPACMGWAKWRGAASVGMNWER
jgi:hypothetical protein